MEVKRSHGQSTVLRTAFVTECGQKSTLGIQGGNISFSSLFHAVSYHRRFLSTYYVPGDILAAADMAMDMTNKPLDCTECMD